MCGPGIEQHYLDILEEEANEEIIEDTLVQNTSFASISFSTFSLRVPAPQ